MKALILVGNSVMRAKVEDALRALRYQWRNCDDMPQLRAAILSESFDFAIVDIAFGRNRTFEISSLIPNHMAMLVVTEPGALPDDHIYRKRSGKTRTIDESTRVKELQRLIEEFAKEVEHEKTSR